MSNCGTIRARHSISLKRYYGLVQEAVKATYSDALALDFDATNTDINCSGIGVSTDEGHFLFQLMMYSTRRIVVDHRRGDVGHMVSDAIMSYLGRKLNGTWTEDCLGKPLDPGPERPLYFMDYVRRSDGGAKFLDRIEDIREGYFTGGNFAKFWSKE